MAIWTVDREFDQSIRHVQQGMSGGSFVAIFTLRLSPEPGEASVRFANAVEDSAVEYWVPFIEEGIQSFVEERRASGQPIGYLRVTLVSITLHEVDSKPYRFREAAEMAMSQAFQAAGVVRA
jgi:translation elongation factor EF-G